MNSIYETTWLFYLLVLVSSFIFIAADLQRKVPEDYVALNEKVSISKYELTILEYKKYLAQIKLDSSAEFYDAQQPDSSSLQYIDEANDYYGCCYYDHYFSYPGYFLFPMVGISYDQAINFCRWKNSTQQNFIYRLPTPEEWDLAYGDNEFHIINKRLKNVTEKFYMQPVRDSLGISMGSKVYPSDYNVLDLGLFIYKDSIYKYHKAANYGPGPQPNSIYDIVENKKGMINTSSNVSEMTSIRGIAKGSNFLLPHNTIDVTYSKPEAWLGVRLVAERK